MEIANGDSRHAARPPDRIDRRATVDVRAVTQLAKTAIAMLLFFRRRNWL
jgi:hypothetical protein